MLPARRKLYTKQILKLYTKISCKYSSKTYRVRQERKHKASEPFTESGLFDDTENTYNKGVEGRLVRHCNIFTSVYLY